MKVAIIGAGLSGLTAATTLAQAGFDVTVFEQNSRVGGVAATVEQQGFRWDLGQLLIEGIGPDEPVGEILAGFGLGRQVKVVKDDRGYVFPDFEIRKPVEFGGARWRIEALKARYPQEAAGLERYWQDYLRFMRLMTLARGAGKAQGMGALLGKARLYSALLPFLTRKNWSAERLMDSYFQSEELKMVFVSILADFFTPPSQFIGLGVFAINPEPSFEKRMPKSLGQNTDQLFHYSILGGVSRLSEALAEAVKAAGGQIVTAKTVERITAENGRVTGLVVDGAIVPADVIVASGGAKEVFFDLLGKEHLPAEWIERVENLPLMDSVFMVHLGLDFDPRPYVHGVCTYYYGTYDLEGGIRKSKEGYYHEGQDGFVVHVPSLHSPEMAPSGKHAMTIYTISPDRLSEGAWAERREELADRLVGYAEAHIPGLSRHVVTRKIYSADDFRQIAHTKHHAFGGLAPIMNKKRVLHRTPLQGLWFIGQQSESGGGIGTVMPASFGVAKQIIQEFEVGHANNKCTSPK